MTTNLSPNQSLDTDSSAQESPMPNDVLNNNELPDNQPMMSEQVHDDALDDEELLIDDGNDLNDSDIDDNDIDDSDMDGDDDEAPVAGQAVPVIVDMTHVVTEDQAGLRIDKVASQAFSDFSRVQLQNWITDGSLLYNGSVQKPKVRVKADDVLHLSTTLQQHGEDQPENIDIDVVYEDDDVLVINKPVGMVVHPGAGNQNGTLVNALLYHYPQQHHLPRAGLVHRIDKDTSGLLLIGKTKPAQMALMEQLKDKSVYRHYKCVVAGDQASLSRHRRIDAPIGRHRNQRTKMTVMTAGREAVTHLLNVTPLNENYCLLDVGLETGRTHQIRVHLSHITYPLVGDRVYGGRRQLRSGLTEAQRQAINNFPRQALHAYTLGFVHPTTGEDIEVTTPLPEDMQKLMAVLSDGYYEE
ncbi:MULTISPECIES: RluA family pseudouridine synthase [Psychrobacter]|uniref:RluA family pseudouridine synthase n=1 Tax=Psychrobacter TaxID=497 RepID=UPI000C342B7D|nr:MULTISPECIES: RluA family pseudouridine synthase [Psychrobacter]MBA6245039.1 RluA family pseudouridine synthase [Psychrobacter sp. Urea-trap-18]MBA6285070.1 RluA family pseudouridine synthase [Psychrobacter sp. Urea-trap-16]MBA6317163.1 RluA family pseudouridine synthase [Psychrobacter sp. Urea-trap-20]MBA6333242.1 RluA family pseudouridine synthase [Psychrobacter sp. Urea-trap-19]PKG61220.1 RluA family pseudouridine synthase [Psychrobacter sp. Choline-3u-12]